MSVEPATAVPLLDADRVAAGREAFLAAADFEGFLALDALLLAGPLVVLVDFFALVFAIVRIHLFAIALKQPALERYRGSGADAFKIQATLSNFVLNRKCDTTCRSLPDLSYSPPGILVGSLLAGDQ